MEIIKKHEPLTKILQYSKSTLWFGRVYCGVKFITIQRTINGNN